MKNRKVFLKVFLILVIIIVNTFSIVYADPVKVTEDNFKESLQKFFELSDEYKDAKLTIENNQVEIVLKNNIDVNFKYDLNNKPTFTTEVEVKQGMSYEKCKEELEKMYFISFGYISVANIQGAKYEDALTYALLKMIFGTNADESKPKIIIDENGTLNNEGQKDSENIKVIQAAEFDKHVIEYVDTMYEDKMSINDADTFNTFEMVMEKEKVSATSRKIKTTLTVNADADFSKIKSAEEQTKNLVTIKDNNGNIINNLNNTQDEKNIQETESVANIESMPKTGKEENGFLIIAYIAIGVSIFGILCLIVTRKKV